MTTKKSGEIRLVLSCTSVNRPRGGGESVTLQGMAGSEENAALFGANFPNVSLSLSLPPGAAGQGLFDPELDYDVVLTPRAKA